MFKNIAVLKGRGIVKVNVGKNLLFKKKHEKYLLSANIYYHERTKRAREDLRYGQTKLIDVKST